MNFDIAKIVESKLAYKRKLMALPIVEKLRLLDALRERALTIQRARGQRHPQDRPMPDD